MNTNQENGAKLPIKRNLGLAYFLSSLVAALMAAASLSGLLFRQVLYPTEELIGAFVANDIVNLCLGLPILLGSMLLVWRGKLVGLLFWPGALFYVFYNYIAYVLVMPLNVAYPLHLALVAVCGYALPDLLSRIDGAAVKQRLVGGVQEKITGGILVGLGLLFLSMAIGAFAGAISGRKPMAETEIAVRSSDMLIMPAWIIGGILLWKRSEFGYVAGLGLLFQGSMLFIGLIVFLLLRPSLTATPFVPADVIVVSVMAAVCFVPFGLFVHGAVSNRKATSL